MNPAIGLASDMRFPNDTTYILGKYLGVGDFLLLVLTGEQVSQRR